MKLPAPRAPEPPVRAARPRKLLPLVAFGHEIMEVLMRATREPLRVPFPTLDKAMRFRKRVYQLREAMSRERHPDWGIAMQVRLYVDKSPPAVRLEIADSEFRSELSAAEPIGGGEAAPTHPDIDFDSFLSDLEREQKG